jgi:lysophospholipase L1-like esterase
MKSQTTRKYHNEFRSRLAALISTLTLIALCSQTTDAQSTRNSTSESWVATWATAQELLLAPVPGGAKDHEQSKVPDTLHDQTVRMIVHTSIGGNRVRIHLSNAIGAAPVTIGSIHIANRNGQGSQIVADSDRTITFSGKRSISIQPGVIVVSDPIDLDIRPGTDLAVSLFFPQDTGAPTNHLLGLHKAFISKGDTTSQAVLAEPAQTTTSYLWLASVDVSTASPRSFSVVALGDSITDGYATTLDANRAWPTLLAKRLVSVGPEPGTAVLNQGISGNQVLRDGAGTSAQARFDRDVLSQAGVKWMILLEGINDINLHTRVSPEIPIFTSDDLTSDDLIGAYVQLIERAHTHGIRVIGATMTPEEGVWITSKKGEEIRQAVNKWIRTSGRFDAIVDFDAVIRDPNHPEKMRAEFDPGDHIHPNDEGNRAMANAFDLSVFRK